MKPADIIFRVAQIVRAVEARSGLGDLDVASRELLRFIGEAEAEGEAPNSTAIVRGARIGTAPTTYTRLAELKELGWVETFDDREDGRFRRFRLSSKARRVFSQMSSEIAKECQSFAN